MRLSRTVLLSGAAALGLTGLAALAHAQTATTRVMTVRLPNGQIEQIQYAGDVPPQVVLLPSAVVFESPFAMLARMSAEMDRQAAAMMRAVNHMAMQPMIPQTTEAAGFGQMPAAGGVCMRSVQITYMGNGQQPHVVSRTSGDCGPSSGPATPAEVPPVAPVPNHQRTIEVKAAQPYQHIVHEVSDARG
jgi:hypothetical protein